MLISHRKAYRRRRPQRGITVTDLLVTMMILGILAAAAAPRFAHVLDKYRAEAVAHRVVADLRLARRQSISTSSQCTFQPIGPPHVYQLTGVSHLAKSSQPYVVDLSEIAPGGLQVTPNFDGEDNVTFDVHGLPWTGSPPTRVQNGTITIQVGNVQHVVIVNPETGRSELQ